MKPGKLTCAGLVGIMMVLPNVGWPSGERATRRGVGRLVAKPVLAEPMIGAPERLDGDLEQP